MGRFVRLPLSFLACAAAAPALAQTPVEVQVRPHAPSKQIRYDLATQTFERVPGGLIPLGTSSSNPITTVDNTNASGFFSPIGSGDEWMDWGFSTGNLAESTVCEFTTEYATEELDLAGTGVVDLEIAFYAEPKFSATDLGDCNGLNYPGAGKGIEVARFVLTDLPGDNLPGDGFAASRQTTIDVSAIGEGFNLPGDALTSGGTEGVLTFRFEATNGSVTELIDTATIPNPTPQTIRMTFSDTNFPEVESWDFSCSNENQPPGLIQFITVQSPTSSGFEQRAGFAIGGSAFPSSGDWTP